MYVFEFLLRYYAGVLADLDPLDFDPPRIWTPGSPYPLADLDPPSQIWTPQEK